MKKKIVALACVGLAVTSLSAMAADVRVKGSIAPSSCSITLTNATFDYGRIDRGSLSATRYTKLDKKTSPYIITCEANTRVGIKSVDNRVSSKVPGIIVSEFPGYHDIYNFGLGETAQGEKIGGYVMHLRNNVADGKAVSTIGSNNNGGTWHASGGALGQTTHVASWSSGTSLPVSLTTISGNLEVQAVINRTSALTLNQEVNLDGHATLELRYL